MAKRYEEIPDLYGHVEEDPIKIFLIEREFAYSAILKAVIDKHVVRDGVINLLDGPETDDFYLKKGGREIADEVARGQLPIVLDSNISTEGLDVAMIDVVTYPFWHCLITGIDPFAKGNEAVVWKVNHNLLVPFIPELKQIGFCYTFTHLNEHPIDDAPTHNVMVFNLKDGKKRECLAEVIKKLVKSFANVNIVGRGSHFMDDRYCLNKRLPSDPPCSPIVMFKRQDLLMSQP